MENEKCEFLRKYGPENLGEILKKKLSIPIYQRDYAWEEEEIDSFLEDVEDIYNGAEDSHFFGQIVVHFDEGRSVYNIIDGQQRISTAVLLVNNIQKIAEEYEEHIISQEGRGKLSNKFRNVASIGLQYIKDIELNEYNLKTRNSFFEMVLNEKEDVNDYKHNKVNKKIKNCDSKLKKYIEDKIECKNELESKCDVLDSIQKIILHKFVVIYLETSEIEKAFIIFETLNAMGKSLETAEILKNYVLMKSEDKARPSQLEKTNKTWNRIASNINQIDMTTFIRHYWNSQKSFVRKDDLYKELVKENKNYEDVKLFLESLEKNSETYAALYEPYESNCFKSNEIKETIENINSLGAKTYYPIILALKNRKYEEKYILDVLHILENYIFRNYTICGKNPNSAEKKFSKVAKLINDEGISVELINKEITGEDDATEEEFEIAFKNKSISRVDAVKYLLRKIHNYISVIELKGEGEKALSLLKRSSEDIHLEHILPQKSQKWTDAGIITIKQAEDCLWKIGNLTLLGKEFNEIIQNDLYQTKREKGYIKSRIHPNEYFNKVEKWDVDEIKNRQTMLYEYAKNIWTKEGLKF